MGAAERRTGQALAALGTEQTLVVAGLTVPLCWQHVLPLALGLWMTSAGWSQQPRERRDNHTCLVLPRHEQPNLSSQPQQCCTNHLHHGSTAPGKSSLLGIPCCSTSPPKTGTSRSAILITATTATHEHTQHKQRREHPIPKSLGAREVSKGKGQKSCGVLPPHRTCVC